MLLSEKQKTFSENFIKCLQSAQHFVHFKKKNQLYRLNISKVIDPKKCSYLNARKLLFQKTLPESTCSRVPNTAETYTETLLSYFSINSGEIQLENISLSHSRNLRTAW